MVELHPVEYEPAFAETQSIEDVQAGQPARIVVRPADSASSAYRAPASPQQDVPTTSPQGWAPEVAVPTTSGQPSPGDLAGYLFRTFGPPTGNIESLATGQPAPPMANFPEQPGKVPEVGDPRWSGAVGEAANIGAGMIGPPMKGAALAAAPILGGVAARLAPGVAEGAAEATAKRMARITPIEHSPFAEFSTPARKPVEKGWMGSPSSLEIDQVPASDFHWAAATAKAEHKYGAAVTLHDPEAYSKMQTFLTHDNTAGVALNGDDIVSVFKHPDSKTPGVAQSLLNLAVEKGGRRLDAFDTVLPHLYGKGGFRAVARIPFDPNEAPVGWDYHAFGKYNGGRPDVVFMVRDPYNPGYHPGQGKMVGSYDDAVALQKQEVEAISQRQQAGAESFRQLSSQIPGLKGLGQYLTPGELELVTKRNAQKLIDVFNSMPSAEEMAAVAYSGRAKRGWYQNSAQALVDIFGVADAPRFAALLGALSPQTKVEHNASNALQVWNAWVKAGRPTDAKTIFSIVDRNVGGKEALGAWKPNAFRALSAEDPRMVNLLSGPKVGSFHHNLMGEVNEVTNDAWMANYAEIEKKLLDGLTQGKKEGFGYKAKSPGYMAMSGAVRRAAKVLSQRTGEVWTPAEIQETIWSWAKTVMERGSYGSKGTGDLDATALKIIKAGDLSHEEISKTPDFALLLTSGIYRKILEEGGYGANLTGIAEAAGRRSARSSAAATGSPTLAEGSGIAQPAFSGHLHRAARRLDERREAGERQAKAEGR